MPAPLAASETLADVLKHLGNVDPRRIRARPAPGRATEKDVLRILDHENRLYELVDGVLVEKVLGLRESQLAAEILIDLGQFVRVHKLGIVNGADGALKLPSRLIRIPDVSFISWAQLPDHELPADPIPSLYPDLAVEVLSESNTRGEMWRKLKEYFFAGSRLVWYVDADAHTVQVFTSPEQAVTLREGDALDGGDVLPGFRLSLAELFARVPKQKGKRRGQRKRA